MDSFPQNAADTAGYDENHHLICCDGSNRLQIARRGMPRNSHTPWPKLDPKTRRRQAPPGCAEGIILVQTEIKIPVTGISNGCQSQHRLLATSKAARLMPCSSLLVGRRGARRTDRDCVLTKEAYLDVCLYFRRVAKNFIWAIVPPPD